MKNILPRSEIKKRRYSILRSRVTNAAENAAAMESREMRKTEKIRSTIVRNAVPIESRKDKGTEDLFPDFTPFIPFLS